MDKLSFRCPFEVKGVADNSIKCVELDEDRPARLEIMREAILGFHEDPAQIGIRFTLAPSLWDGCKHLRALKERVVPFQCEIIATDLEYRLYPFLTHQIISVSPWEQAQIHKKAPLRMWEAYALSQAVALSTNTIPSGAGDIALWLEDRAREYERQYHQNREIMVTGPIGSTDMRGSLHPLITVGLGQSILLSERSHLDDSTSNRNIFSIVLCPFYPPTFGRYSPDVEIVVTREADIDALSKSTRQKIRTASNRVLKQNKVKIKDLADEQQELGVWIPKYKR